LGFLTQLRRKNRIKRGGIFLRAGKKRCTFRPEIEGCVTGRGDWAVGGRVPVRAWRVRTKVNLPPGKKKAKQSR